MLAVCEESTGTLLDKAKPPPTYDYPGAKMARTQERQYHDS